MMDKKLPRLQTTIVLMKYIFFLRNLNENECVWEILLYRYSHQIISISYRLISLGNMARKYAASLFVTEVMIIYRPFSGLDCSCIFQCTTYGLAHYVKEKVFTSWVIFLMYLFKQTYLFVKLLVSKCVLKITVRVLPMSACRQNINVWLIYCTMYFHDEKHNCSQIRSFYIVLQNISNECTNVISIEYVFIYSIVVECGWILHFILERTYINDVRSTVFFKGK